MSRVRYKLVVAYDGTDFCGWQKQEPPAKEGVGVGEVLGRIVKDGVERVQLRTVQHVLEQAVRQVVREEVVVNGASRTDSGVHAWGQVASFVSCPDVDKGVGWPGERGCDRLVRAVNSRLPRDVWVRSAEIVSEDFNVIGGAVEKEYTYTMACGEARPVFGRRYVWHTWYDLDVEKMNEAAKVLIGEHDFAGFAQVNHGRKTTVREIFSCSVVEVGKEEKTPSDLEDSATSPGSPGEEEDGRNTRLAEDGQAVAPGPGEGEDDGEKITGGTPVPRGDGIKYVRVRVSGSGFLYNMVRIVAGTLMEVGRGKMTVDEVRGVVENADRLLNRGPTLPPTGLRLEWIRYD